MRPERPNTRSPSSSIDRWHTHSDRPQVHGQLPSVVNRMIQRELHESQGWHLHDTTVIQYADQLVASDRGQRLECCRKLCLVDAHERRQIMGGVDDVADVCECAVGGASQKPKFGTNDVPREFRGATRPACGRYSPCSGGIAAMTRRVSTCSRRRVGSAARSRISRASMGPKTGVTSKPRSANWRSAHRTGVYARPHRAGEPSHARVVANPMHRDPVQASR